MFRRRLAYQAKYVCTKSPFSASLVHQCILRNGLFSSISSSRCMVHKSGIFAVELKSNAPSSSSSLLPSLVQQQLTKKRGCKISHNGIGVLIHTRSTHSTSKILPPSQYFYSNGSHVRKSSSGSTATATTSGDAKWRIELVRNEMQLVLRGSGVSDSDDSVEGASASQRRRQRCLPLIWLRDHCRCPSCYNHDTHQKDNVGVDLLEEGRLDVDGVCLEDGDTTLVVRWKDGHISKYSVDWLLSNSYSNNDNNTTASTTTTHSPTTTTTASVTRRVLWDKDTIKQGGGPPPVSFTDHVDTEEGLRQTLQNLIDYGYALITQAPVSVEGTKVATDRVAPIQETFFGGMFQMTSNGLFSDTAYATGYLSAHTDNTYLEMPAGIQVFQCLEHDGKGGENLLVDGFHAVDSLRKAHPDAVRCLSDHLVAHEYKESPGTGGDGRSSPGFHMYTLCPVIRQHPATGEMIFLRFNPYDRAPLRTIPPEDMMEFYRSYRLLSTAIDDPKGQFWLKLTPGTILLVDNWRVLHGRSAFDGKRVMCGCYLRRDDWVSRVRVMGMLEG